MQIRRRYAASTSLALLGQVRFWFGNRTRARRPDQKPTLSHPFEPGVLAQIEALERQVETLKQKDPAGHVKKNASKRLVAIAQLAFDVIPQDPTRPEYRLGGTLGGDHKHWFRAKFLQQYRLFFRYHAPSKVIVYAWVNDEATKRAYESSDDTYRVFRKVLESGHPPDDWDQLLAEAQKELQRM